MTENLIPLNLYIRQNEITIGEVLKLGLDLCDEISSYHSSGAQHCDIKVSNIYVTKSGHYKIADFDTFDAAGPTGQQENSSREDICSLGMVLYKLLNDQRIPFLPDAPAPFTAEDKKAAKERHLSGERIPLPANAKKRLGDIVVKACSSVRERAVLSEEAYHARIGMSHEGRDCRISIGYVNTEELKNDLLEFQKSITGTGYDKVVVPQVSDEE